jgi:hypothetical protein
MGATGMKIEDRRRIIVMILRKLRLKFYIGEMPCWSLGLKIIFPN